MTREGALRAATAALVGVLSIVLFTVVGQQLEGDFVAFYTGASLARTGHAAQLYDPVFVLEQERIVAPNLPRMLPSHRPAFYYGAIAPFSLIPYAAAFWCWIGCQIVLLLVCWLWGFRRFGSAALLAACLYPPVVLGIAHGQDCVFMLAIVIGAYSLAERRQDLASGAVLGLALAKPHLLLCWPLALVARKRWRMLAGVVSVGVVEAAVSVSMVGLDGLRAWFRLLGGRMIEVQNPPVYRQVNLQCLMAALGIPDVPWHYVAACVVVLLVCWRVRRAGLWQMFSLATAGSLLIAPHVLVYDWAMLLLPLWFTIFSADRTSVRGMATLMASPFIFSLIGVRPWWSAIPSVAAVVFLGLALRPCRSPEHLTRLAVPTPPTAGTPAPR